LFSLIGLSHGDDVPDAVALRVDHDHRAASKPSEINDSDFTMVSPAIMEQDRGAGEDGLGMEAIHAVLLEGS
jgi:hypothetical protein